MLQPGDPIERYTVEGPLGSGAVVTHLTSDGSSVIDVRIEREGELTVAHVASRPTLPTQIVDGGSNRRNVDSIVSGLLERFPVAD